jgi:hypothetical protein
MCLWPGLVVDTRCNKLPNEKKKNKQPEYIKKKKLKAILVEYPYYSVDEYLHSSDFIVNTC